MPDKIVINTSPLIAIYSAIGNFTLLDKLFHSVIIPFEVYQELFANKTKAFDEKNIMKTKCFDIKNKPVKINTFLKNSIDIGEASVIQTAIKEEINTVCIDEIVGRRIARLNNLKLTGSLGIIISAIRKGEKLDISNLIRNMRNNGVWISKELENKAVYLTLNNK